ncbi:hypothetical protein [Rossellomorea aquimaris]|uniref:hypothetical protein n=1 Tax=Rossellomorea aquimaris TaxID=189382 RepID=UPI0016536AE0|nr:hypothetical protein [Rossellomorea aquimaris]
MSAILDIVEGTKRLAEEREVRESARIEKERAERQTGPTVTNEVKAETEEIKLEGEDE